MLSVESDIIFSPRRVISVCLFTLKLNALWFRAILREVRHGNWKLKLLKINQFDAYWISASVLYFK